MSTAGNILLGVAALIGLVASAYIVAIAIMDFAAKLNGEDDV
jgi:phage shock protein PspC (stress-responsive transcriptional regulator)